VNRARVPSSLRKHLRNQKSDSCPGLWAAVRLVGYQGFRADGSNPRDRYAANVAKVARRKLVQL
jgi:hypothetical protein